jgi:hypothetical protein
MMFGVTKWVTIDANLDKMLKLFVFEIMEA